MDGSIYIVVKQHMCVWPRVVVVEASQMGAERFESKSCKVGKHSDC